MHIGIAGTGKMGSAMARRLLGLGHQVSVWNRTVERLKPLVDAGCRPVMSLAQLPVDTDAVITMLTDDAALDQVYAGGLLGQVTGKLIIDMSTVHPSKQRETGARVAAAGAVYVECPVGGTVGPALEGKLLGFAGGAAADVARARPLLDCLCRRVEHVGPLGAGATMKLAINLPLMVYWQTLGEALSLIAPLGLDPARVIDIFSETSGGPNMLKARGPNIAKALAGQLVPVTVELATMRKDVRTMIDFGLAHQLHLPLTTATLKSFDAAADQGMNQADCTQLPAWWIKQGSKDLSAPA